MATRKGKRGSLHARLNAIHNRVYSIGCALQMEGMAFTRDDCAQMKKLANELIDLSIEYQRLDNGGA